MSRDKKVAMKKAGEATKRKGLYEGKEMLYLAAVLPAVAHNHRQGRKAHLPQHTKGLPELSLAKDKHGMRFAHRRGWPGSPPG